MPSTSLFWHDYETWGIDPRYDRPSQFAGIRTDLELNVIDEPVMLYCKPPVDYLPHPMSALVTHLTPRQANERGVREAEFFSTIHEQLSKPGTCGVGYNSIRFDDEVTRFGFYRNFFDPYAREWQNGNSRWDILDLLRLTHALRPEGITWPEREGEPGITSFRLDQLTVANGIAHEDAHDALADVHATIAIARLVRQTQPRLFDYYFNLRLKRNVQQQIDLQNHEILLHASGMYPAELGSIAPVLPLIQHPTNSNGIIVYDLRHDPSVLLKQDSDTIRELLYTRREELPEGHQRPPLKTLHINKSPAIAPVATLTEESAQRWQIDLQQAGEFRQQLLSDTGLTGTLEAVYSETLGLESPRDADMALYGGFLQDTDRKLCERVRNSKPDELACWKPAFRDARLKTLYFRYRARNWPETLTPEEKQQWTAFCSGRLEEGIDGVGLTCEGFTDEIAALRNQGDLTPEEKAILDEMEQWPGIIRPGVQ
jgi:exodeoxyribonuclease-1